MMTLTVNGRILMQPVTGVQRYAREILSHWQDDPDQDARTVTVHPSQRLQGLRAHAWEQCLLPGKVRGLLWSPSNSGPWRFASQVVTVHDMVYFDCPETLSRRNAQWYQFLLSRLLPRVRRIITISAFTKDRILAHVNVPEERIAVIPNGVSDRFAPQSEETIAAMRASLGLPDGPYVLCLGSVQPRKNVGRLVQAWAQVQERHGLEATLIIAGQEGEARHYAACTFGTLPERIHFTGHVPDAVLPALIAGARMLVYPSLYEGFGLPPLEAMASGVPVITSRDTAMAEVVGDAGMLIDPMDAGAIAGAIIDLADNDRDRDRLARLGRIRAVDYSWARSARQTREVLQDAA